MAEHKDYWCTGGDQGTIKISEDVVASISALATSETEGVSGLYSSFTSDIASFLGKKSLAKGVKVALGEGDTVEIDVCFLARFGFSICEVAKNVQAAVRSAVESMTGLKATCVNIHVGGVTFDEPEAVAEPTTEIVPQNTEVVPQSDETED